MNNVSVKISPSIPKELSLSSNDIVEIVNNSLAKVKPKLTNKLEIEIIFATEEEIKCLNLKHRKIDAPTDVLSFPQSQVKKSLINILGSIMICLPIVFEKEEEISSVIKHGLLHLLGYDHETEEASWEEVARVIDCNL